MQHIDSPAQIEALSGPVGVGRVRVQVKTLGVMTGPERRDGISNTSRSRRYLRQQKTGRPSELKVPVRPTRYLVALLVHGAVMPAT